MASAGTHSSALARRSRPGPVRTCAGCRAQASQGDLVRFVRGPAGEVVPDVAGGGFGRGAWVHPRPDCLGGAARGGLARSFRQPVTTSGAELASALGAAADRRTEGLIAAARRAGKLAVGSEAVKGALQSGRACLVIVATDARAAAQTPWVEQALSAGRAAAWGVKSLIGRAVGRNEAGVLAVLDEGLSDALSKTIRMAHLAAPQSSPRNVGVGVSTEV